MKGIRAWHIAALLAIILLIKAVLCWSNGLLFTLFGLSDVFVTVHQPPVDSQI